VLISLDRKVQMAWLASHSLPRHVAYFSLSTFTDRPHVARILCTTYDSFLTLIFFSPSDDWFDNGLRLHLSLIDTSHIGLNRMQKRFQ